MAIRSIKASSLIETIVAMLVLVLVFLFSVMIINNVMHGSFLGAKTKATLKMYELLADTKKNKLFISEDILYASYTIKKEVSLKSGTEDLWIISFSLQDEKGIMVSHVKEEVLDE